MNRYEEAMKQLDEKLGRKDGLISLSTIALDKGGVTADAAPPPAHWRGSSSRGYREMLTKIISRLYYKRTFVLIL